jgi:hypothetical protein
MTRARTVERLTAMVMTAAAGVATLVDIVYIATFHGRGSPDVASILLLVVIAALHLALTTANGGLAAVLGRRRPAGVARLLVWGWLVLSGVGVLVLAVLSALLST